MRLLGRLGLRPQIPKVFTACLHCSSNNSNLPYPPLYLSNLLCGHLNQFNSNGEGNIILLLAEESYAFLPYDALNGEFLHWNGSC